ncbi:MAG TPA: DNA polymerase III subunit gamma/tau [Gammaproteobacteria bacterium]|nr:DNA polymerase III subunit gamma/tau [Gammaproteobacteria bacterium]
MNHPSHYQVLARKWRPRTFQQMVGQEHVQRMLTNALDSNRLHHAYLFTGTRGVGKTTLARLLAKCLNCETGVTSTPCDTCDTCQAINAGTFLDLMEVDAASRTKVEDTRELLDNVQYTPTRGRYKIYLIDEVHMLSGHSFNALLKTLEEPPAYVKFLLATTEPKRLPMTILSRCLQFHLHPVAAEKIAAHLAHICVTEKIEYETTALACLAKAADGSLRDALSLLDQAIAFCAGHITLKDMEIMLGTLDQDIIFHLLDALLLRNGSQLLADITDLVSRGSDFTQLLEDMLSTLHQIAVAQVIPDLPDTPERIAALAKTFSAEDVQLYYQIALIGRRDLPFAPTPHLGFEMVMLRLLAFHPARPAVQKREASETPRLIAETTLKTAPPEALPLALTAENWPSILEKLSLSAMTSALASHCVLSQVAGDKIELSLAGKHESLLNKNQVDRIEQALARYLGKPVVLVIKIATTPLDTPAGQQEQKQAVRQADATTTIQNNANVQKIMDLFDATLDVNSITAT